MVIDNKTPEGKRISVNLDDTLAAFLALALPKGVTVRSYIRNGIKTGAIRNSSQARDEAYKKVIKPSLLSRHKDAQTDIEDYC